MEHFYNRRQTSRNRIQNAEAVQKPSENLVVSDEKNSKRDQRSDEAQKQALNDERSADKGVRCADQLHDSNLVPAYRNTDINRVGNQENGYDQKQRNDRDRHISEQRVKRDQRLCRAGTLVDLADTFEPLDSRNNTGLILNLIYPDGVAG